jgi:hypothetical protein
MILKPRPAEQSLSHNSRPRLRQSGIASRLLDASVELVLLHTIGWATALIGTGVYLIAMDLRICI